MDKKTTDIVAYLSWVGLVIAFVAGDRENSKFHLNQSLVIWAAATIMGSVTGFLGGLDYIGWIFATIGGLASLFCTVCWFIGFIGAIQGNENPVPVLGQFKILK